MLCEVARAGRQASLEKTLASPGPWLSPVSRSLTAVAGVAAAVAQPQLWTTWRRPVAVPLVATVTAASVVQPPTGEGASQRAMALASPWSGTVPTTVIRPAPTGRVVTAAQRPRCG